MLFLFAMTVHIHRSEERGITKTSWLLSRHSFSFGEYYDSKRTQFGALLVLNDDLVQGGEGFGMHGHANMEIITFIIKGGITHKDSMKYTRTIREGQVQKMSAGTGVLHSEYNPLKSTSRFLQLWIQPDTLDIAPSYEEKDLPVDRNILHLVASGKKKDHVLFLQQDAFLSYGSFDIGKKIEYTLKDHAHGVFLFVVTGEIILGKENLFEGDSLELTDEREIRCVVNKESTVLVIEVPLE